ncbi:MAG: hypothetical protein RI947_785 [Candidatus Parcubacteria bacterium]
MSASIIVAALQDAGMLGAAATETEIATALAAVYQQLALGTSATGTAMSTGQVATAIANQTLFAERVAQTIRTTQSLQALSSSAPGAVTRMLSAPIRSVIIRGGGRAAFTLLSWPAILALIAVLVAISGGAYLYTNWGKPSVMSILPGWRMGLPKATPVTGPGSVEGQRYAVFLLPDNSGGTIYIGQEETLKSVRGCDTPNGGVCDDPNKTYPPVRYQKVSADFDTSEEAFAAACQAGTVKPGYWGQKLVAFGGEYWFEGQCPSP